MNQKLILENWRKFLKEEVQDLQQNNQNKKTLTTFGDLQKLIKSIKLNKSVKALATDAVGFGIDQLLSSIPIISNVKSAFDFFKTIYDANDTVKSDTWLDKLNIDDNYSKIVDDSIENSFIKALLEMLSNKNPQDPLPQNYDINKELEIFLKTNYKSRTIQGAAQLNEAKKSKSGDRCTRIAKRKYDVWPSAYASGAVVRCRQGKIWKGVSENATNEEIDTFLLLEKSDPKGFSQKAHCQGKKLNENTTTSQLEEIANQTIRLFTGKSDRKALQSTIYDYFTKDSSVKDEVLKAMQDTNRRDQYNQYWTKVKNKLSEIAKNNGWTIDDSGAWFQFTKPYNSSKNSGNFKYYITFEKGQKYFDNINKLGKLITSLNSKKTNGKVSFKIATHFLAGYQHNDSVVIHYNYKEDEQAVVSSVKEVGFEAVDRQKMGRTDLGRDEDTSDSDLVAKKVVETIEQNKNVLLPLLSAEKTSQEYKKGLSGIKHIIDTLMQKSSHRNVTEAKKKAYKPNFSKEKEQGLHGWFARNDGKGWVNCRTGGPCGRDSTDKGGKYPACRPTKAQCKSAGKGPLRKKNSSSPISWTKKKKD
jgi:hypothetical protein